MRVGIGDSDNLAREESGLYVESLTSGLSSVAGRYKAQRSCV